MKLKDFRQIIDELDDSIQEDCDIVIDIDTRMNGVHLIDIAEIYHSKLDKSKVKIEPSIELFTEHSFNTYVAEEDNIYTQHELKCPKCGANYGPLDRHCRICGAYLPKKHARKFKHQEMLHARLLRQQNREKKRALNVIKRSK